MEDGVKIFQIFDTIGFEGLVNNNYDTLCMNYLNEKLLAQLFKDTIVKEIKDLSNEGAEMKDFKYKDNGPLLELFEKPNTGILGLIDEFGLSNGDDKAFFAKFSSWFWFIC